MLTVGKFALQAIYCLPKFKRFFNTGGIVVRILHHVQFFIVHQLHDVCIFVPMIFFGQKTAWVNQPHDTVQLNLFYMMIGLAHHEEQTSCT